MLWIFLYLLKFFCTSFGKVVLIFFLPRKKIPSVKQWVIMLCEYIQLGEKKLIKKSAAQIPNIHILSWESHYCINKEGFLSSLSSDNLVCKWWDDGRNHRREAAISFSLTRVGSSFSRIPKGIQDSKDDGEGKNGSEGQVHRSVIL